MGREGLPVQAPPWPWHRTGPQRIRTVLVSGEGARCVPYGASNK